MAWPRLITPYQYAAHRLLLPETRFTNSLPITLSTRSEGCNSSNQRKAASFGSRSQSPVVSSQCFTNPVTLLGEARYSVGLCQISEIYTVSKSPKMPKQTKTMEGGVEGKGSKQKKKDIPSHTYPSPQAAPPGTDLQFSTHMPSCNGTHR